MNAGRLIGGGAAVDRRGMAILAASAGLHLVVLTLIGLDMAKRNDVLITQDRPVVLDLKPWPAFARAARPVSGPAAQPGRLAAASLLSPPAPRQPPTVGVDPAPLPTSPPAASNPPVAALAAAPALSRADAVGASLALPNAWRGDVCRNPADFAAWQAARCGERGPAARAETRTVRDAEAAIGERRGDASERRREEGFAQQKAINDRWLEYYRYRDAPYPGLRSLASQL
ncbi:MAG: hypothetical protein JWR59_953 [Brevundimonas sp.]|nr:hypothetical protein [Brevundimonas sp.]